MKVTIELDRDQLETLIGALDYQNNGLFQQYSLDVTQGVESAPPGVQERMNKLVALADELEDRVNSLGGAQ